MKHVVLGTAGHIDHGKTLLTKALTGVDTDRLEEEKSRGITIELGFAPMKLSDGTKISIVDVPGHEKFVKTMMAGASGVDGVLLTVAADDGVMPQTKEHMDIIRLLRVQTGIVVLTKCDLADESQLLKVHAQIADLTRETCLENAAVCEVSALTGSGIEDLKREIETLVGAIQERSGNKPARLPTDRVFQVSGFGSVATGTLTEGILRVGDTIEIYPQQDRCTVRTLQNHNKNTEEANAGTRTAMSFSGLKGTVSRGSTIAEPESMIVADLLNVWIQITPDCAYQIKNSSQMHLFHGTEEVICKLRLLDADRLSAGQSGYAQLKLNHPIAVRWDDRFILRFFSPVITVGGGTILSCGGTRLRRNYGPVLEQLARLNASDPVIKLSARIETSGIVPVRRDLLRKQGNLTEEEYASAEQAVLAGKAAFDLSDTCLISCKAVEQRLADAEKILHDYHETYVLQPGMRLAEWREKLFREKDAPIEILLRCWIESGALKLENGYVSLPEFEPVFTQEHKIMQRKILHYYRDAWFQAPDQKAADEKFESRGPIYKQVLVNMRLNGKLIPLTPRYWVHFEAYEDALRIFSDLSQKQGKVTLGEFRTAAGISRKYSQLFLEYWDRQGISRRIGDAHVLLKKDE